MTRDDILIVCCASIPVLLGGFLLTLGARNVWRALASPQWPKANGAVVESAAAQSVSKDRETGASSTTYSANIVFKYAVDGRDYTTDILHFGQTVGSGDSSEAELRRLRYPVGAAVRVSYDSGNPSIAAVEPGFDADALWLPGGGLAFLVPGIMIVVLYLGASRGSGMFGAGMCLFAGIFATIGMLLLSAGLMNLWRAHMSQQWPRTPGVIVHGVADESESVAEREDEDMTATPAAGPRLIFRYRVNGVKLFSNVRRFGQLAGSSGDWAEGIAGRYPLGKAVQVAYSPENAALAVLEPGIGQEALWLPGAGAAFLLFGLAVFIWGIPALTRTQ